MNDNSFTVGQRITTDDELDMLPVGATISTRDRAAEFNDTYVKNEDGQWFDPELEMVVIPEMVIVDSYATVRYLP